MKNFFKGFGHRLQTLIFKLVGFEGVIWIVGTKALFDKIIDGNTWMLLSLGAAGVKTFQKMKSIAEEVKEAKNNGA